MIPARVIEQGTAGGDREALHLPHEHGVVAFRVRPSKPAFHVGEGSGNEGRSQLSVHEVEKCPEAPHFRSKIEIQKAIEASGLRWTLVMPNNFFQNDLWFRQAIMEHGVYPQPFGDVGLSRVDVRDIAEAIAAAATESGHDGQRYPLVGPDVRTGTDTAAIWSRHLGREVRYGGNGLEAWALQSKAFMPEWMIEDFRIMYRFFQEKGLRASDADFLQQAKVLKHPPRPFEDFAQETAAVWRG